MNPSESPAGPAKHDTTVYTIRLAYAGYLARTVTIAGATLGDALAHGLGSVQDTRAWRVLDAIGPTFVDAIITGTGTPHRAHPHALAIPGPWTEPARTQVPQTPGRNRAPAPAPDRRATWTMQCSRALYHGQVVQATGAGIERAIKHALALAEHNGAWTSLGTRGPTFIDAVLEGTGEPWHHIERHLAIPQAMSESERIAAEGAPERGEANTAIRESTAGVPTTGWVVERTTERGPRHRTNASGEPQWSDNAEDAHRFDTRAEAHTATISERTDRACLHLFIDEDPT